MVKVGIPQALLFYQYYPMWRTFFQELGAEVVVSAETNQAILAKGSARVVPDTCLPVKVFLGHVLSLVGKCDRIFIPSIRSVRAKVYNCSKFLGLADMTRMVIPESPPILDIGIDLNRGQRHLYREIYNLGRHFTPNPFKIRHASLAAWETHRLYRRLMAEHSLTPLEMIALMFEDMNTPACPVQKAACAQTTIALIGHPYLIGDHHISHRLLDRLRRAGCHVMTPEMLTDIQITSGLADSVGQSYWTYEDEVVGAASCYLKNGVDGVVSIMAFGCGPDSLMMDTVQRLAVRNGMIPYMSLTIDEHTAESGLVTRLEAFLDMVKMRNRMRQPSCP
ncbi:MAG: acyl-CoA dehydratase activase-related protein [Dehalococcoidales bacterium]|jgi:predicted nucleotide-binding protein (sugar kinase/HSP70/actin superfamily)